MVKSSALFAKMEAGSKFVVKTDNIATRDW